MSLKNTILVVDDDNFNRKLMHKLLNDTYTILEAVNGKEALEVLEKHREEISAVMLDLVMPVMDGYEFLRESAKIHEYANIPMLVVTSDETDRGEATCLELGAWDFIRKPFDELTLKLRLSNIISRSHLYLVEQLKNVAEHDPLTGLFNRAKFFAETRRMLDENPNTTYAFVRFDIERFHLINSFFGESEGNRLLKYVADYFREMDVSEAATYGRIESDVFCLCVPHGKFNIINEAARAQEFLENYNYNYYIEPNYGIYIIDNPEISVESMYERATMASKQCKNKYMNYIEYYNDSMNESLVNEQRVINEMHNALADGEFVVYLQPKYSLSTNTACGAEALVRWNHPQRGMINPGMFIPIFESNGFIGKLDYYMWENVCVLLKKWRSSGQEPFPISVNVSRANMYNPHLVEMLTTLVKRYDVPPELLQLELTESSYMDNPNQMKKTVLELKKHGFKILMDDFGSGYSSLNTLKNIDVDILKVDMQFLPTGEGDIKSEHILSSVIRMAGWLDLPVVVEGVETYAQKEFLVSIGCLYVQGYLYARPMPVAEYEKLIESQRSGQTVCHVSNYGIEKLDSIWSASPYAEQIFKNIMLPIAVYEFTNGKCEPLRFNKAFIELFGLEQAIENTDSNKGNHVSHDGRLALKKAFECAVEQRGISECDYKWMGENRSQIWLNVRLQYVKSVGESSLLFALFTDVTEHKKLEFELYSLRGRADKRLDEELGPAPTILVTDNSPASRKVLQTILHDKYSVIEAQDGARSLSILNENRLSIDAVILNIDLPVTNGEIYLKSKNSNPNTAGIPVIAISGEGKTALPEQVLKMGADFYVQSVFQTEQILDCVKKAVKKRLE